jgi:hypothetical protein
MIQQSETSSRVCRYCAAVCAGLFLLQTTAAPYPPQNAPAATQPQPQVSPQQLDDLVAPIAIYPDPLVGEVLAASTYPMEVAEAEAKGTLRSTPQETVTTQNQDGQSAISIEPANPDVWDVPNYNPAYVWGAPDWGVYPPLLYPGIDMGLGWYPGIDLGLYFGGWGGWGWGGWGWNPNWYGGNMFIDNSFFNRYGFRNFQGGGALGNSVWMHNPEHRLGVPYANREMAGRYAPNGAPGRSGSAMARGSNRGARAPQQQFGNRGFEQRGSTGNHSVFGGYQNGGMTRMQSDHGFSSMGAGRTGGFGGGGGMRGGGMQGGGEHGGGGRR